MKGFLNVGYAYACVTVSLCVCSAKRELVTTAIASLILSPADVPSFLTNHRGLPSGHYNPRSTSKVHMYHEREHRFSLFAMVEAWRVKGSGVSVRAKYLQRESRPAF